MTPPPNESGLPWRLLGVSLLLAVALPYGHSKMRSFGPRYSGRAEITQSLLGRAKGWQLVVDRRALGAENLEILTTALGERLSLELPSDIGAPRGHGARQLISLRSLEGARPIVSEAGVGRELPRDPLFAGGPLLAGEWTDRQASLRATLHRHSRDDGMFSGRLRGSWPALGSALKDQGFPLQRLGPIPESVERLVAIDASLIALSSPFGEKLEKSWRRWEFATVEELRKALGPSLTYLQWEGRTYFCLSMLRPETVARTLAKRFPASVVPTAAVRAQGARIKGFDPDGPAWAIRGDYLLATRGGGTASLEKYLGSALHPERKPSRLWAELQRLALTEPGWHLVLLTQVPELGATWAALVRWPKAGDSEFTGFVVIETSLKGGSGQPTHKLSGHNAEN